MLQSHFLSDVFASVVVVTAPLQPDKCLRIFLKLTFYWPHLCSKEERGNLRFVITSSIKREIRIFVNGKEPACERLAQCFSLCFHWPSKIGGNMFFSVMDSVLMQRQRNFSTLCRTRSKKIYVFLISAELSFPRLRVLLHFDTQEFLNVLSMVSRFN